MRGEIKSDNSRQRSIIIPPKLKRGDRIRFVSPASTPDRDTIVARTRSLEELGFRVDFGAHAFDRNAYRAGTDDQRLDDMNVALRDTDIRAIFATRGGKGSYRIADRLDFDALRFDPKVLVGFSDITILHLMLLRRCGLMGIHGARFGDEGSADIENRDVLVRMLTESGRMIVASRPGEPTGALTTTGKAKGPLVGGNLDLIVTAAGWTMPDLTRRRSAFRSQPIVIRGGSIGR
jgi:muramoyltetrapeptide carboxypeptidase